MREVRIERQLSDMDMFLSRVLERGGEVETRITYMDYHLSLLHSAITSGNEAEVEFQKSQLSKIRNRLVELEYFQEQPVVV